MHRGVVLIRMYTLLFAQLRPLVDNRCHIGAMRLKVFRKRNEYRDNTFSKWFTLSCQNVFVLSINMSLLLVNFPVWWCFRCCALFGTVENSHSPPISFFLFPFITVSLLNIPPLPICQDTVFVEYNTAFSQLSLCSAYSPAPSSKAPVLEMTAQLSASLWSTHAAFSFASQNTPPPTSHLSIWATGKRERLPSWPMAFQPCTWDCVFPSPLQLWRCSSSRVTYSHEICLFIKHTVRPYAWAPCLFVEICRDAPVLKNVSNTIIRYVMVDDH